MKRLLLTCATLALLTAGSAHAGDMAEPGRYMPPPRKPVFVPYFSWNGFYMGLNAGYGFGNSRWTNTATGSTTGNFGVSGPLAGSTIGYNMQIGGTVFGVEADLAWANIKGSASSGCSTTCETTNTWFGTARGRLGYAFDRFMPYFTAGAAFGGVKLSSAGGSTQQNQFGWTAGAGVEYAFAGNWTVKLEYLYADLGKLDCNSSCTGGDPFQAKFNTNIVRTGLNYKF